MEDDDEWLIEVEDKKNRSDGTGIFLKIKTDATYTAREVFRKYENDDHGFAKRTSLFGSQDMTLNNLYPAPKRVAC